MDNCVKKPLVVLTGATGVGKTELSVGLAKEIGGAVISADSMQVYQYMDIGSAKIQADEMQGVPHYLIDECLPEEEFHVVKFQEYAKKYLAEIYEKGLVPIVVGGTGFYIQALLYDIDFTAQACDGAYRREMEQLAKERGNEYLHRLLAEKDPRAAEAIHPNNVKRVIRALEFYEESGGKMISEHNEQEQTKESPYHFAYFVLNDVRELVYEQIDRRVDLMLERGLVAEVRHLKEMGYTRELVSMQGLGYKEILSYLDGEITYEEAVRILKRDTRHFAKRQITWFKRERDVIWLNKNEFSYQNSHILEFIVKTLKNKKII